MAACSLGGASSIKFSNLYPEVTRCSSCSLHSKNATKALVRQKPLHFAGLVLSRGPTTPLIVSCNPSSETATSTHLDDDMEGAKSASERQLIPNSHQVHSLLTEICDTTSIAEFEMKLGGFRLYVTRNVAGKSETSLPPSSPIVSTSAPDYPSDIYESASTALAVSTPITPTDEGLTMLKSNKVGFFKRSRVIKGRTAPPSCKEKQIVKEGQVLCYIEQLGGQYPVESAVSGEVVKILKQDGDPVGYGDALIAILPSFPGIKKLQ